MYKGLARLIGMDLLETGQTVDDEFKTLEENWDNYDFFFYMLKKLIVMARMETLIQK